jgi:small subunit ribosomal protein S20
VRTAIGSGDATAAGASFARAAKALDKAVTKGVLHRNAASRRVARLARAVGRVGAQ